MSFKVGIREQTLHHLTETRVHEWQEHSRHCHVVSRLGATRRLTAAVDRQLTRDVAYWDLVGLEGKK